MTTQKLYSRYDVIIVGAGIAGLLLALELDAGGMRVALICKSSLIDSNTALAQGGMAACTKDNTADSPEKHLQDTLAAGAGLCDARMARTVVEGGLALFEKLESLGLSFDRQGSSLELAREGGHSQARVLHSRDSSGKAIAQTLIAALSCCKRLAVFENMFVLDLITQDNTCIGLRVLKNNQSVEILSPRVVLSCGGAGQVFERTSNPSIATGDGPAMAYRAGASLVDLEFVQFHPTALCLKGSPAYLISEAVRGDGAQLLNSRAERFAFRFHKNGELSTRDVVSRAISTIMQEEKSNCVWLDMRPIGSAKLLARYPNIIRTCRKLGLDPLESPIPVAPAAHYFMGGIYTDDRGRSTLAGLYALGECASTGLHGANRLASNSLLEGGVMALRTAQAILSEKPAVMPHLKGNLDQSRIIAPSAYALENINNLREQMFLHAGIIRDGKTLSEFIGRQSDGCRYQVPLRQADLEAANIGLFGNLIACSALARCESRGAHWRSDYPYNSDSRFLARYFVSKESTHWRTLATERLSLATSPARAVSLAE